MIPQILFGDALALLPTLPGNSYDVVLTDPPYPSLDAHRDVGTTTRLQGGWFPTLSHEHDAALFHALYRVLKPGGHLYVFCDFPSLVHYLAAARPYFHVWKTLAWVKTTSAGQPRAGMGYHYSTCHEHILFCSKGKPEDMRPLKVGNRPDTFLAPRPCGYPTEKPLSVVRALLENISPPEVTPLFPFAHLAPMRVLDPFAGSGVVGLAAEALGWASTLIDIQRGVMTKQGPAGLGVTAVLRRWYVPAEEPS